MKINLLLHAGRHKSGTTSLQATLTKNITRMLDVGILYPKTGRTNLAHHEFATLLNKKNINVSKNKLEVLMEKLLIEVKSHIDIKNVLMSSEAFQNVDPGVLKRYFSNFEIKPIFFVRNKHDYLISSYSQKVHAKNYVGNVDEYWRETFSKLNYKKYFTNWRNEFGRNLEVNVYDREILKNNDIVVDFFDKYIGDINDFEYIATHQNPSLKFELLLYKIAFNAIYPELVGAKSYILFMKIAGMKKKWTEIPVSDEIFAKLSDSQDEENNYLESITNKKFLLVSKKNNKGCNEILLIELKEIINSLALEASLDINVEELYKYLNDIIIKKFSLISSERPSEGDEDIMHLKSISLNDCANVKLSILLDKENISLPAANATRIMQSESKHLYPALIEVNNSVHLLNGYSCLLPSGVMQYNDHILEESLWMSKFHRSDEVIKHGNLFITNKSLTKISNHIKGKVVIIYVNVIVNYFHWHFEVLARAWAFLNSSLSNNYDYIYAGYFEENSFQYQSLVALGIPKNKILNKLKNTFSADEFIYPVLGSKVNIPLLQGMNPKGAIHRKGWSVNFCNAFPRYLLDRNEVNVNLGPKLFVNRIDNKKINIINLQEVRDFLLSKGFFEIDPSQYSFNEQISIFSHAEEIVGVHGGGLTNGIYSNKLKYLVEFIPADYADVSFRMLAQLKDCVYIRIDCKQPNSLEKKPKNDDVYVCLPFLQAALST
jgi:hypothetical protein